MNGESYTHTAAHDELDGFRYDPGEPGPLHPALAAHLVATALLVVH